jgi:mRNA interferase RelE/StbE
MKVEFTRKFENQIDHLRDEKLKLEIANAVKSVMVANSLHDIPHLKKLSGFKTAFRIRTGNYRIGVLYQNGIIYFVAFAHRKDIYKQFPGRK